MSIPTTFTLTSPTQDFQPLQLSPSTKLKYSAFQQSPSYFLTSSVTPSQNSINQIYNSTKELITEIDNRISKSNNKRELGEMKSSQKYHHMVKTFETEIIRLKKRLKLEQSITNPTKQYINDMLNSIVSLRRENETLRRELDENKHSVQLLRAVVDGRKKGRVESPHKDHSKSKAERLPSISGLGDIKESVERYLTEKELVVNQFTKLHRFLKDFKKHHNSFDLPKLLNEMERWVQNQSAPLKAVPDTLRLRYHLNHISPVKKSRKKINSIDFRSESTDFERFTMPPQQYVLSAKKMIKKRECK